MEDAPVGGRSRAREAVGRLPRSMIHQVLSSPEVVRAAARIREHELLAGAELRPRFQEFAERHRQAVNSLDHEALSRVCPGKHVEWGRACVLDADHDAATGGLHWGLTPDGIPVAWVGNAPDDD